MIDDSDNAKEQLATAPKSSPDAVDADAQMEAGSSNASEVDRSGHDVGRENVDPSASSEDSPVAADSSDSLEPVGEDSSQGESDSDGALDDGAAEDLADDESEEVEDVEPLELIEESGESDEDVQMDWYILKVQVNRENTICDALQRNVKVKGLERYFGEILIPTEDVREFTKTGKQRVVKRKLYPGYILVNMAINDDTWFLVRETPGIGDFTGSIGKPTPMDPHDVERILATSKPPEEGETTPRIGIKFKPGDRVRVKEGYFQNFEGEVDTIDEANGRITVMINIFGRATPVELDHWQFEEV